MAKQKKKFKKIAKWKIIQDGIAGWEIIPLIIGGCIFITPIIYGIRLYFKIDITNELSLGYLIFGGSILMLALVMFICRIRREVYYEEV